MTLVVSDLFRVHSVTSKPVYRGKTPYSDFELRLFGSYLEASRLLAAEIELKHLFVGALNAAAEAIGIK
jgi:hypothetical protein